MIPGETKMTLTFESSIEMDFNLEEEKKQNSVY